tara:strand:+ start:444 stop:662 length:219 start_codon:yes stop_codon:yes gene_type:complete
MEANSGQEEGALIEIQQEDSSDVSMYAHSISNSLTSICSLEVFDNDDKTFKKMQIKRLIDAQLSLRYLFVED